MLMNTKMFLPNRQDFSASHDSNDHPEPNL